MNQHVRTTGTAGLRSRPADAPLRALRRIAALAGCHHALVLRLAPAGAPLHAVALLHNWRDGALLALRRDELVPPDAALALSAGVPLVTWEAAAAPAELARHRLARAQIGAFAALPFHNGRGANLALLLCDERLSLAPPAAAALRISAADFLCGLAREPAERMADAGLSPREAACLQWTAAGKTSEDCAAILGLSPHTVNQHLARAAVKLGAVNRAQAVAKAARAGLIDLAVI